MQLSDDRTQATLAINKTLTAPEIENLIRIHRDTAVIQKRKEHTDNFQKRRR